MFFEIIILITAFAVVLSLRERIKRLENRVNFLEENTSYLLEKIDLNSKTYPETAASSANNDIEIVERNVHAIEEPTGKIEDKARPIAKIKRPIAKIKNTAKSSSQSEKIGQSEEISSIKTLSPTTEQLSVKNDTIVDRSNNDTESAMAHDDGLSSKISEKLSGISFNFEDLFGRRLPIWAGGITLAIAGILIVKYAIDAGFFGRIFTPGVQVIFGLLFGGSLIAGAEFAYRNDKKVEDPRIMQALSGAGIATIYAAILVASNIYALISPMWAFTGFALTTVAALGLSIRFGAAAALLGLAGGLAAPAMTGSSEGSVSLLAVYLGLTIAGMAGVSRMQRWPLLGLGAIVGGAGWSFWMILASNAFDVFASLSVGSFIILLAIVYPMVALNGPRAVLMRSAAAIIGAAQLAILIALGGFEPLHFGLFILLAAAGQWLNWREEGFEIVPTISLGVAIMLLAIWPDASLYWFIIIGGSLAIIHAVPLFITLWREPIRLQRVVELSIVAIAIPANFAVQYYQFESHDLRLSALSILGAMIMAAAVWTGWNVKDRRDDMRFTLAASSMTFLIIAASFFALSSWIWPLAIGLIAAIYLIFGEKAEDWRIEIVAGLLAAISCLILLSTPNGFSIEIGRLFLGNGSILLGDGFVLDTHALLRWGGLLLIGLFFSYRSRTSSLRVLAFTVSGLLAYGFLSQILPLWMLPIAMAFVAAVMFLIKVRFDAELQESMSAIFGGLALLLLFITGQTFEIHNMFRGVTEPYLYGALRWGGLAAISILFVIRSKSSVLRLFAQVVAAILSYGMFAQILPEILLPMMPAIAFLALAYYEKRLVKGELEISVQATMMTFLSISVLWFIPNLLIWLFSAIPSLVGFPFEVESTLSTSDILSRTLMPGTLILCAYWLVHDQISPRRSQIITISACMMSAIAVHILYRMGFAHFIGTDFIQFGLLQRLIWDVLLLSGAAIIYRMAQHKTLLKGSEILASAVLMHSIWYSLILHNPLWTEQMVGNLPIINLIIPIYAIPYLSIYLLREMRPEFRDKTYRAWEIAKMVMILCLAWTLLRQIFHAPLLTDDGVTDAEDISRSILAIILAVGYLLWGIRAQLRDWRIMSLILILLAVCKVFLLDASGLDGLLRIASFIALGFSLMGIGWLYSRQLGRDAIATEESLKKKGV